MPAKHHLGVVLLRFKSFTCWQAAQFTQIAGEDSNIFSHHHPFQSKLLKTSEIPVTKLGPFKTH